MDMVELASTENMLLVEEKLVVSIIIEFSSTNCEINSTFIFSYSHPGNFGKVGQRHFHLKRNQYFTPTLNLDHLWSLVSEQTRLNAQKSKDRAPVIDVTKAVNYIIYDI